MALEIRLTGGHVLLCDDADYALLRRYVWHAIPARKTFYAQASGLPNLTAHRLLIEPPAGLIVDHHNRNGLDNRRSNLRLCTQSQNKANMPAPANNTSGYKGVSLDHGRWAAYITVDYRKRQLGRFADPWEAAQAYNAAALEAWGDFAYLNTKTSRVLPGLAAATTAVANAPTTTN